MENKLPTGLQLVRALVKDIFPKAIVSGGIEEITRDLSLFSIRVGDHYATFILKDGTNLRQTGTKKIFDLRIPTVNEELKTHLKKFFRCAT